MVGSNAFNLCLDATSAIMRPIQVFQDKYEAHHKMYLELRHLRTIRAIHETGGLARAAEQLNITQSALSHQVKALEEQVGIRLFVRRSKPLKLSAAGQRLLSLAKETLPKIDDLEADFAALRDGSAGRLHIAIECHACFEWLFPVLESFRKIWPDVDVDIRPGLAFDALPALERETVDLVVSSDPEEISGVRFEPLFDYRAVFLASAKHKLASKPFIEAHDFRDQILITYPVERARLDVFKCLLMPEKTEPASIRQVELTAVILLLVASDRGVAVLPDWVVEQVRYNSDYVTRPLTKNGITRRLYAAIRDQDSERPYMADLIRLAREQAERMQGADAL